MRHTSTNKIEIIFWYSRTKQNVQNMMKTKKHLQKKYITAQTIKWVSRLNWSFSHFELRSQNTKSGHDPVHHNSNHSTQINYAIWIQSIGAYQKVYLDVYISIFIIYFVYLV